MEITGFKKYTFKLLKIESIIFVLAALLWVFMSPQGTPFYICLFIIACVFIGLGTLFYFGANNAIFDDYRRRGILDDYRRPAVGTSMTNAESEARASDDKDVSYFQASLFLWSGSIAAGLSLAFDFLWTNWGTG